MSRIRVQCDVTTYDEDADADPARSLSVESHWNRSEMVNIRTSGGKRVTVLGADLIEAVKNCMNTR